MATKPREYSASGFYHVMQRGVCLFDIFEDDADRKTYLGRLRRYAMEVGAEIHAWCLMDNHVHLLLRVEHDALSAMMRQLGSTYARYFNRRHGRTGPLFEGRFSSVCVETDAQIMAVVRYIHRNPIHHNAHALLGDFAWSSYAEYVTASPSICKLDFILSLFGNVDRLARFHESERDHEHHLEVGATGPMTDEEARRRANRVLAEAGFNVSVSGIGTLLRKSRDKAIALVKAAVGCSLRQIQRLTSIAYSAIRNAIEDAVDEKGAALEFGDDAELHFEEPAFAFGRNDAEGSSLQRLLPSGILHVPV